MSGNTDPATNIDQPATAEDYYTLVKAAIKSDDLDEVKSKLSQWRLDPSITSPSQEQFDYLVPQAARDEGHPKILEYLLSLGGKIGAHSISLASSPAIFQIFKTYGFRVEDSLLCSHVHHPELIALFLSQGANPDFSGPRGFRPLDIAALHGPLETVKLLLDYGATIDSTSAALHAAVQGDAPDRIPIMAYLVEHGADINGLAKDYPAPSEAQRPGRKGTPLHTAAKWANDEAKEWLLEHGADPGIKNELGETPEQWGRRFDSDGPEPGPRLRRSILRKNRTKKD
ncbi:MAG: hypothetical protein Q9225_002114 [Loekoesia sp. 1 TL-2023]